MMEKEIDHDDIYQMVQPYPVSLSILVGWYYYDGIFSTLQEGDHPGQININ